MAIGKASQRRHIEQEPERWRRRQPAWATRRVGLSWFLPTGHHGCLFSSSCFLSKEIGLPEQRPVIIITSFAREPGLTHHTQLRSIADGLLARLWEPQASSNQSKKQDGKVNRNRTALLVAGVRGASSLHGGEESPGVTGDGQAVRARATGGRGQPALPAPPGALTDLHTGLGEVGPHGQLLPRVHVGVVGLLEDLLQLLQLVAGESGSVPPLLALVALRVGLLQRAGEVGAGAVLGPLHPSFLHTEVAVVHPHRVRVGWQLWLTQRALFG